jgi:hypothetical protein
MFILPQAGMWAAVEAVRQTLGATLLEAHGWEASTR